MQKKGIHIVHSSPYRWTYFLTGRGVRTKAQLKGLFSGEKEPPPGSSMIKRWARSISITLFHNQLLFLFTLIPAASLAKDLPRPERAECRERHSTEARIERREGTEATTRLAKGFPTRRRMSEWHHYEIINLLIPEVNSSLPEQKGVQGVHYNYTQRESEAEKSAFAEPSSLSYLPRVFLNLLEIHSRAKAKARVSTRNIAFLTKLSGALALSYCSALPHLTLR